MKKFANIFLFSLAIVIIATSCEPDSAKKKHIIKDPTHVRSNGEVDAVSPTIATTMSVKFGSQMISLKMDDIINISEKMSAEDQDAMDIMNLNQKLMSAEKEAQLLDINFTMSDDAIDNGMFIFGIQTEDAKELVLEMHDEEGFTLVANNIFKINKGQSYKAVNVSSLDKGTYNFRIKDDAGRELNREIKIVE